MSTRKAPERASLCHPLIVTRPSQGAPPLPPTVLEHLLTVDFRYSQVAFTLHFAYFPPLQLNQKQRSGAVFLHGSEAYSLVVGAVPHCPSQGHNPKSITSGFNPGPLL